MKFKNIFRKPGEFKPFLLDNKYRIVQAFDLGGRSYFMFDSQFDAPTGRQLAAMAIHEEMRMNCDREYLEKHVRAMEILLSGSTGKINLNTMVQINQNLKERLELMTLPGFVYKVASVVFFDDSETPYTYDYAYNNKKIALWKENGATLDFFLKTPLSELLPSLRMPNQNSETYFQVAEQVNQIHQNILLEVLSESTSMTDSIK